MLFCSNIIFVSVLSYLFAGCPSVLRTDLGTENSNIAVIQPILRHYDCDSFCWRKKPSIWEESGKLFYSIAGMHNFYECRGLNLYGVNYVNFSQSGGYLSLRQSLIL